MAGPTTAALERDVIALTHRISAIEDEIRELRRADSRHHEQDREDFEADRERITAIDKATEDAKRIIGDISRDVQEVEKKVGELELARAANKWIDRLINAAVVAVGGLFGAAIFKLIGLMR